MCGGGGAFSPLPNACSRNPGAVVLLIVPNSMTMARCSGLAALASHSAYQLGWPHVAKSFCLLFGAYLKSGVARVRLADLNGPLQANLDQNGPFWSILVSRMLKSGSE